jgi:hypothetical protein
MSLVFFELSSLKELDGGKAAIAFRRAVEDGVKDCQDRPTDDRPRKVFLELQLVPIAEEDPQFENTYRAGLITGQFRIKTTLPHRQTKPYSFGLDGQGRLYFSSESPLNVRQSTIDDIDPATGKACLSAIRGPDDQPAPDSVEEESDQDPE